MSREGKIHLVESYSGPQKYYKNVTNEAKYEALKEAASGLHNKGKSRLTEGTTINKMKKALTEANIDTEIQKSVIDALTQAGANVDDVELWQFPISKINTKEEPNLNGRVYNEQLWKNVIEKQRDVWQGGTGLANHPADDEDGDFMKQSIVWLDGFLGDDGIVYGIGTFVGDGGVLARQIISVGGRVGFSTSGYGDFLSDGITVDPDDYEIDRLADLVLNPSQGVYGDYRDTMKAESVEKKADGKLTEGVERNKRIIKESEENEEEETTTLSEQLVLDHYTEAIQEIAKESNKLWEAKIEKLESLTKKIKKETFSKTSKDTLNKQINALIESIMKDARKAIQEGFDARKICEELDISNISKLMNIKEKLEDFTSLEQCLDEATKEASKYKTLYEEKEAYAIREAEDGFAQEEIAESLDKEVSSLKKSLKESNANGKELKKQLSEATKKADSLQKCLDEAYDTIDNLEEENEQLKSGNRKNLTEKTSYDKQLADLKKKLAEETAKKESLISGKKALLGQKRQLLEQNEQLRDLLEEAEKTIKILQKTNLKTRTAFAESKLNLTKTNKTLNATRRSEALLKSRNARLATLHENLKNEYEDLQEEAAQTKDSLELFKERAKANASKARQLSDSLNEVTAAKDALQEEKVAKEVADKKAKAEAAREDRLAKVRARLHEKDEAKKASLREAEFYDDEGMFRESDEIDSMFDEMGVDGADYSEAKTAEEAFNNYLFSNELLDDEAEEERAAIRAPVDTPVTLADMFN